MQFLFYASSSGADEIRIKAAFQAATAGQSIEQYSNLADLEERLRRIVEPKSIAVLVAADREELRKMQEFHDMVMDVYVILVLPDWQENTIKLAHLLRPRFITQLKNDSIGLDQIVAKMILANH
jgi:hypothetical protein